MKTPKIASGFVRFSILGLAASAPAHAADTFAEAVLGGEISLNLRYRFEAVDEDNALKDARASTVRTRLGYMTGQFHGFSVYLEAEDIRELGADDYNSTTNGKTQFSVVADPEETEVNQAFLSYAGLPETTIKLGRQRIILDNARFVGNVGWRQNEQTYDAITIVNQSLPHTKISYGYIENVNRIFGDDSPVGDFEMDSHLVNIAYDGLGFGTLVGYAYLLDFEDTPASSQQTLGLRFSGSRAAQQLKLLYALEYAHQEDFRDGSSVIDADYFLGEIGLGYQGLTAKLGYELLGGDGDFGFSTPLATLHAFNGWSDQFLNTPPNGLQDLYVSLGAKIHGVQLLGVYHDFSSDNDDIDFGSEVNLLASKTFAEHYTIGIKYAGYDADEFKVDTDKLWVWGELKF